MMCGFVREKKRNLYGAARATGATRDKRVSHPVLHCLNVREQRAENREKREERKAYV
jgi:hypothetical protein